MVGASFRAVLYLHIKDDTGFNMSDLAHGYRQSRQSIVKILSWCCLTTTAIPRTNPQEDLRGFMQAPQIATLYLPDTASNVLAYELRSDSDLAIV